MYRFAVIIFAFKIQIFLSIEIFTFLFLKYDFGKCHPYLLIQNERWEVGDE